MVTLKKNQQNHKMQKKMMHILYIENSLKTNHFSTKPLFLLKDSEICVIPPVHTEENQQNTKYKNKKKNCK